MTTDNKIRTPSSDELKATPQLAVLAALALQLQITTEALTAVHKDERSSSPALHQARSIASIAKTLGLQIEAYRRLLETNGSKN